MYIHYSLYKFIAPLGSIFIAVPEKIVYNLSETSTIKHRRKLLSFNKISKNNNEIVFKTNFIGQDKKIYKAEEILFFEFSGQNIILTPLQDAEGGFIIDYFFKIFKTIKSRVIDYQNAEFDYIGFSNRKLNLSLFNSLKLEDIKFKILEEKTEKIIYLFDLPLLNINSNECDFKKEVYGFHEFKEKFPNKFNELIFTNSILFF